MQQMLAGGKMVANGNKLYSWLAYANMWSVRVSLTYSYENSDKTNAVNAAVASR